MLAAGAVEQRERIPNAHAQHGDVPHDAVRQLDLRA
jgi:hypothetical protein